jgi:hypothetical protein
LTVAAVIVVTLALVVALLAAASVFMGALPRRKSETVVVHTKDQQSIQGVLLGAYRDALVLGHPRHLDHAPDTTLGGDAIILRGNVAWIQGASE